MTKILEVKDLEISFDTYAGKVRAIRGVNFHLNKGETLAIVGESGSGKSVTTRSIMRLLSSNANIDAGQILFKGNDIVGKSEREMQKIRGKEIAMIFQDPMTSLDPTMPIGKQVAESLRKHNKVSKKEGQKAALELLKLVGIPEAEKRINSYPHQFSGGQRQRIVIAIALVCYPEILIADEPTTALDVTIQAQIIRLIKKLQKQYGYTIIFITHDLGVVANVADRVAIMYSGQIIEYGTVNEIFYEPKHPYTWGLLSSLPQLGIKGEPLYAIHGTPPSLYDEIKGDAFAPRSDYAMEIDFEEEPPMFKVTDTHYAKTWLLDPRAPKVEPPAQVSSLHERMKQVIAEQEEH